MGLKLLQEDLHYEIEDSTLNDYSRITYKLNHTWKNTNVC